MCVIYVTTASPATPRRSVATPAQPPAPVGLRPHKEFLTAWTLLLLDGSELHGYALSQQLRARGVDADPTGLYRWLRKFEQDGWIDSRWSEPVAGPRRRSYRLSSEGRAELQRVTGVIDATRATYDAFVQAHEQAMTRRADAGGVQDDTSAPREIPPRDTEPSSAAAPPAAGPLRPHRELLAAWLMLHLEAGPTYGYDLRREVDAHELMTDPGTVYRMLRGLESDGWVQSRWMSSSAGPRRRVYRLTPEGRRNLDDTARLIAAIRDSHDAYMRAYEQAGRPGARG